MSGGARAEERAIRINGKLRYPDIVMEKGGVKIAIQVGKREKRLSNLPGKNIKIRRPIKRERLAIDDLKGTNKFKAVFICKLTHLQDHHGIGTNSP